jgi:hypothetical protein
VIEAKTACVNMLPEVEASNSPDSVIACPLLPATAVIVPTTCTVSLVTLVVVRVTVPDVRASAPPVAVSIAVFAATGVVVPRPQSTYFGTVPPRTLTRFVAIARPAFVKTMPAAIVDSYAIFLEGGGVAI